MKRSRICTIVTQLQLDAAKHPREMLLAAFASAYEDLRRAQPTGDLHIDLSTTGPDIIDGEFTVVD